MCTGAPCRFDGPAVCPARASADARAGGSSSPPVPSAAYRFFQKLTVGLDTPVRRAISFVPIPSPPSSAILARWAASPAWIDGDRTHEASTSGSRGGTPHSQSRREWGLQPWRAESFKFSTDPRLEARVRNVTGLYLNPPDKAVVLCVARHKPSSADHDQRSRFLAHETLAGRSFYRKIRLPAPAADILLW